MHAQHRPTVGKNGGGTEGYFAWVKSSVAIAGSLQRIAPPSCPAEPPNQALGASQTSPCQQKHKGSPVGCGIWDFSRPELLQVLPGQTHRLPHFPCWQQACPRSSREEKCSFLFLLFMLTAEDTASTVLLCPGPSCCSLVCVVWDSPGDTAAGGLHQSCHQQHPELLKWGVNHSWAPLCGADLAWGR